MATPTKERLIRVTILTHRREGITEEEFHHHWTHVHAPLIKKWLADNGTLRYTQARLTTAHMLLCRN